MNIYEKIQTIKTDLLKANLKKTGENKFAKYKYYELADFLPTIVNLCEKHKVCTLIEFTNESAILKAINIEKPEEIITISSPMRSLDLKGCNEIQSLGGVETYQRRYLYMSLFDIIENDMFDGGVANESKKQQPLQPVEIVNIEKKYNCHDCGAPFKPFSKDGRAYNAGQCYHMAEKANADGKARCRACKQKLEKEQVTNE